MENVNVGRQCRLVVRQPNGVISVYRGTLIREDISTWTIRQEDGFERSEPKMQTAVGWLTGASYRSTKLG